MPRFNRRGQEQVWWCPTISNTASPTVAEVVTAGRNLSLICRDINGFKFGGSTEDAADMSSLFPKTVPGMQSVEQSSLTLYEGDAAADIEKTAEILLAVNSTGYIVFSPIGTPIAAGKVRVWPVKILSNSPEESANSAAATYMVGFSHPAAPVLTATMA